MSDLNLYGDEKLWPQSILAEQALLGSIIIDPEVIIQVIDLLQPDDFYRKSHQLIYAGLCWIYNHKHHAGDFIELCDLLEHKKKLEDVGGAGYITSLLQETPSTFHVAEAAESIIKTSDLRKLLKAAGQIATWAYEQKEGALEKSSQLLYQIGQRKGKDDPWSGERTMEEYLQWLTARHDPANIGKPAGFLTGFNDLDRLLGGFQRQELIILGGRPGEGKTSLLLNFLYNALVMGLQRILIYSLEMNRKSLANRLVSMRTEIDGHRLLNQIPTQDEWDQIGAASDFFGTEAWYVDETGGINLQAMRNKCQRFQVEHGGIDLIVVDFLQQMHGSEHNGKRNDNRVYEVSEISRGLREIAKTYNVPVLAAASLSRGPENRANKRPQLSDLRESGSIESDADVAMFIYRDPGMPGYSIVNIAKHRNGPEGDVVLKFDPKRTRFSDLEIEIREQDETLA